MIGHTISHYRILDRLGAGGMGVVYLAEDTLLHRQVALKLVSEAVRASELSEARFTREAIAAARLNHPGICTIYEFGEDDGRVFIAMEKVEGRTIEERLEAGDYSGDEVVDWLLQMAEALRVAHAQGVIHRDIKPANLMITTEGRVKIMDFGLAKLAEASVELTAEGSAVGSAAYMSPEQALGQEADHRTDVWSFGVVAYELTTGRRPFEADAVPAIMYLLVNTDPAPPESLNPHLVPELARLIARCMQRESAERYVAMDEVVAELEEIASPGTFSRDAASPSGREPRVATRSRGGLRRWLATRGGRYTASAGALVIVCLLGYLFWPAHSTAFGDRDWLLIADVHNMTGEAIFDNSLNEALEVGIGQSKYVSIVPQQRVEAVLQRMKRADVARIDAAIGREIALREGIRVMLVPSIARVGNTFALTGTLEDVETGETLRAEIAHAAESDDVLEALDELCRSIRRALGEATRIVEQNSRPLADVTTSSLEALKQFAVGKERQREGDFLEAKAHFERALEIDTLFASAWASLGILHVEKAVEMVEFSDSLGRTLLERAVKLMDNVTEEEKYGILAFHARAVEKDLPKAIDYHKVILNLHPDNVEAHNNLGIAYAAMWRYEEAATKFKDAIRIDPYLTIAYNSLLDIYLYQMAEIDSALVWGKRHVARNPDHPWAYERLGWAYLGLDSLNEAEAAFERVLELEPGFRLDYIRLSHTYRLQGRYEAAIEPMKQLLGFTTVGGDIFAAHSGLGLLYKHLAQEEQARMHFEQSRRVAEDWVTYYPNSAYGYVALGLSLARLGRTEEAWAIGQKAMEIDATGHFEYAHLLAALGRNEEALDQLGLAIARGFTNFIWMKIHPDLEPLYHEPRFQAMLDRALKRKSSMHESV